MCEIVKTKIFYKKCKIVKFVHYGLVLLLIYFGLFYLFKHFEEETAVKNYLKENKIQYNEKLSKELANQVVDKVRTDFNTNRSTWRYLNLEERPFLRTEVLTLLKYKEGVCGEGSRVLVKLLQSVGFDATRITLYDRRYNPAHTFVSIKLNEEEFFVDSINSSDDFTKLTREYNIEVSIFEIIKYYDLFNTTKNKNKNYPKSVKEYFHNHFVGYTYNALPYRKIFNFFGMDIVTLNLERPNIFISYLAESVYLLKAISIFITLIVYFSIILILKRL
jgi:hypothetical protein